MDRTTIVILVGLTLIVLATLSGHWWLLHHVWRSESNAKVEDFDIDFNEVAYSFDEDEPPIQERWPVFATPKLDILTNANDHAHPYKKHDMRFKSKNFNFTMNAVVYTFKCLYCNFEAKVRPSHFWGKPAVQSPPALSPIAEYMSRPRKPFDAMGISSEDVTANLMAYAEMLKQPEKYEDRLVPKTEQALREALEERRRYPDE